MSNPNNPDRYPIEYQDALELLEIRPDMQIRMEFETKSKAYGQRTRLYCFARAVEASHELRHKRLQNIAASLYVTFEEPATLVLMHRDHSPDAIRMRKALDEAKAKAPLNLENRGLTKQDQVLISGKVNPYEVVSQRMKEQKDAK